MEDDTLLLIEAVRSLPSHAVKDLLSAGACMGCIFRLLGIQGQVFFGSPLSAPVKCAILSDLTDPNKHVVGSGLKSDEDIENCKQLEVEPEVCSICLGILQFVYCDEKGKVVKKRGATDLVVSIAEQIKQEGH